MFAVKRATQHRFVHVRGENGLLSQRTILVWRGSNRLPIPGFLEATAAAALVPVKQFPWPVPRATLRIVSQPILESY
jgi:hypothetical protein